MNVDIINHFPGYELKHIPGDNKKHNIYRGTDIGFGGYVYAEFGAYTNVALLDIVSMHPHSIINLNYFGEYTKNYKRLLDTRVYIKHGDLESAKKLWDGRLDKYLNDKDQAKALSKAIKLPLNATYGLTSASFDNPFTDNRNINNIVALRGALFMRTLQDEIKARGFTVAHIKTDSIKIPEATPEIIQFCMDFAKKYGYEFEHEATYEKMCLVNNAVYIAKYKDGEHAGEWTATGAQFAVPYVFKTLFSREPIEFKDLCETKSVKTALYLDMNETLPDVTEYENLKLARNTSEDKLSIKKKKWLEEYSNLTDEQLDEEISKGHDYKFVGKVGNFCPILPGKGGGLLVAKRGDKYDSASGAKDYRWLESETVKGMYENNIDRSYYNKLVDDAVDAISQYCDFEWFVSDDPYISEESKPIPTPMKPPCGDNKYETCFDCPKFDQNECKMGYNLSNYIVSK